MIVIFCKLMPLLQPVGNGAQKASLCKERLLDALTPPPISTGFTNELASIKLIGSVLDRLQSLLIRYYCASETYNILKRLQHFSKIH
ncbi:hypothetical protein TYRP_016786, partial [Tyrophagus putrescentiae]